MILTLTSYIIVLINAKNKLIILILLSYLHLVSNNDTISYEASGQPAVKQSKI